MGWVSQSLPHAPEGRLADVSDGGRHGAMGIHVLPHGWGAEMLVHGTKEAESDVWSRAEWREQERGAGGKGAQ